jgi:hypothetical protein
MADCKVRARLGRSVALGRVAGGLLKYALELTPVHVRVRGASRTVSPAAVAPPRSPSVHTPSIAEDVAGLDIGMN